MVERSGRVVSEKHDVRCSNDKCRRMLFKTRSVNGHLREKFAHVIEIKCPECGLLNKI